MVEIVIGLAVIVLLAALLIPAVLPRLRDSQVSALAQTVDTFAQGVEQYRSDIRRYPTRISQLNEKPTSARDACGRTVPSSFLDNWRGPYVQGNVSASGFRIRDALVRDSILSSPQPMTTTATGFLLIEVEEVDEAIAERLEQAFDPDDNLTTGLIRWTDQGDDRGLLVFALRIRGC